MNPVLTVAISYMEAVFHCEARLGSVSVPSVFPSLLRPEDPEEIRWLVEEKPRLRSATAQQIADRIKGRVVEIGDALGEAVFSGPDGAELLTAIQSQAATLDVRIVEEPGCPWLPWEIMRPKGFDMPLSCAAASFVRCRPAAVSAGNAVDQPGEVDANANETELRILLVIARPSGKQDAPFRSIAGRIVGAVAREPQSRLRVEVLRPSTFAALQTALAAAAGKPYRIVHFDGHGEFRASPFTPGVKRGYLRFESADGQPDYVDGNRFGAALQSNGVRTLVLNACRSAYAEGDAQPDGTPLGSLAGDVLASGIGSVLAMGFDVYVAVAAALIGDVYTALAAGRTLGEAGAIARRRLLAGQGGVDWMVPVLFEQHKIRHTAYRAEVGNLTVGASAATPAPAFFIDPNGGAGPRSADRPFAGYDGVLLDLEHAFRDGSIAELTGLAGSGKSAVAAEFARWLSWTYMPTAQPIETTPAQATPTEDATVARAADRLNGALAVIAIDVSRCSDKAALLREAAGLIGLLAGDSGFAPDGDPADFLKRASHRLPVFWIFDDAGALPTGDRAAADSMGALATGMWKILLVSRNSCEWPGIRSIPLPGLDAEGINDLAVAYRTPGTADAAVLEVWLDWTQGVPALVLAVLRRLEQAGDADLLKARKEIREIQLGGDPGPALAAACGISKLMPADFSDERTVVALYLFQGFLSSAVCADYSLLLATFSKNFLGGQRYTWPEMLGEFRGAMRCGLVCPLNGDWVMIHPLATFAVTPHFYEICRAMAGADESGDRRRMLMGWFLSAFCQTLLMPQPGKLQPLPPGLSANARRQSLLLAAALTVEHSWWHLVRLLRRVRDELRALYREAEWGQILQEAVEAFRRSPPTGEQSALEDPNRILTRLLAEEAAYAGDPELAGRLNDAADRLAFEESGKVLVVQDPAATTIPAGAFMAIDALLRQSERLIGQGSPEALAPALKALEIATGNHDELRAGEAELIIARARGQVAAIRDLAQYEEYAKRAADRAQRFGKVGEGLLVRAKKSVGLAIVEQLQAAPEKSTEARRREAGAALEFAKQKAGSVDTRASALNGLAMLAGLGNDLPGAANNFLLAAQDFASIESWRSAGAAYLNAALAYFRADRHEDAAAAAAGGLDVLSRMSSPPAQVLGTLREVLRQSGSPPAQTRG